MTDSPDDGCQAKGLAGVAGLSCCSFSAGCVAFSSNVCSEIVELGCCASSISPERPSPPGGGGVSGSDWRCLVIALSVRRAIASDATPIQVPAMPKKMAWIFELVSSSGLAMPPVGLSARAVAEERLDSRLSVSLPSSLIGGSLVSRGGSIGSYCAESVSVCAAAILMVD